LPCTLPLSIERTVKASGTSIPWIVFEPVYRPIPRLLASRDFSIGPDLREAVRQSVDYERTQIGPPDEHREHKDVFDNEVHGGYLWG
jgi:hypothetical protein